MQIKSLHVRCDSLYGAGSGFTRSTPNRAKFRYLSAISRLDNESQRQSRRHPPYHLKTRFDLPDPLFDRVAHPCIRRHDQQRRPDNLIHPVPPYLGYLLRIEPRIVIHQQK
jgi:hypothetical protein